MEELKVRLTKHNITLQYDEAVIQKILDEGSDDVFGARPMRRYIQRNIEHLIATNIIEQSIVEDEIWTLSVKQAEFYLNREITNK